MNKRTAILSLSLLLLLTACSQTPAAHTQSGTELQNTEEIEQTTKDLLSNAELYTPENGIHTEPDTVSADTMGKVLCDQTLPDGLRIVCYWEPGSEYTKYWAVRNGDTLLRFCKEDSGYQDGYAVEPFSDVLGQDGFRIIAPRGAAYNAYDYYVLDSDGVPQLLAGCANEVEELDLNGDGETDLRWYYHGHTETYVYFRQDGKTYLSSVV